jgi:ATP-dependent Clp protease ATP-binding subunit ClpA
MSGENQSRDYLRTAGVNAWKLKWELQQHLAALPKGQEWQGLSDSLKEVRRVENVRADEDGMIVIGTLYLLLGLAEMESTLASRLLREAGVTAGGIRAYLTRSPVTETAVNPAD